MRILHTLFFVVTFFPSIALAEMQWKAVNRPALEARPSVYEGDRLFWAFCRSAGAIELRIGAENGVKSGKGEQVSLRFESAGKVAILRGVSRRSDDSRMTGGTELVTEVSFDSPIFAVLKTGKPTKITGSISKPAVLDASNMKSSIENFLSTCTGS